MTPRHAWLAYLAAGVIIDAWRDTKRDGSTLSQATRDFFHVTHPVGRVAFLMAWGALCVWFPMHVIEDDPDRPARMEEIIE